MNVAEMMMLRWMCGKIRRDMVRNERIRKIIEVVPMEEKMRENLESKGLKISRNKTEYMKCNYSKSQAMNEIVVSIEGQEIPKSEQFRYLVSVIHAEGDIGIDVTHRIKAGWTKWRNAFGVLV